MVINVHRFSCKGPVNLSDFYAPWIFSIDFGKSLKYQFFFKIRPLEAELFHVDGMADRNSETNGIFSKFCETAKNHVEYLCSTHSCDMWGSHGNAVQFARTLQRLVGTCYPNRITILNTGADNFIKISVSIYSSTRRHFAKYRSIIWA
jgi:hypothetical protein